MNTTLVTEIERTARDAGVAALALACHDLETGATGGLHQDRWFHAASTIKLAVLVALFDAIEHDRIRDDARVHVRNQFTGIADGCYFRVAEERDADRTVHSYIGRTMRVRDLARHMIVTSSNLATNVLVEFLGAERIRESIGRLGVEGIDFRRGVEDARAWEAGINNRVTAAGLADLLLAVAEERAVSPEASREMLGILHDQEFISGIPAGAPGGARVANKTGEISTVTHDAAIIYFPDRRPYVLVVLTEWPEDGDAAARRELIATLSRRLIPAPAESDDG